MKYLPSKSSCGLLSLSVVLLVFAGTPTPRAETATATVYQGLTGPDLQRILQDDGYRAELTEDSVGDPLIRTAMNGVTVNIYFYNCGGSGTCNNIRFSVGLNLGNGTTQERANEYNSTKIFGTVNLDNENDPWLKMTHNVASGVTAENIEYTVETYSDALDTFLEHFDFNPA